MMPVITIEIVDNPQQPMTPQTFIYRVNKALEQYMPMIRQADGVRFVISLSSVQEWQKKSEANG